MKKVVGWFAMACVVVVCLAASRASALEEGFKPLFDGKTLKGWKQLGGDAKYRVENGQIVGTSVPNTENTFLCTKRFYSDFILKLEVKLVDDALNSGIQVRSNSYPSYNNGRVHGYQVEIEPNPDGKGGYKPLGEAGYIYDEARRGWLSKDRSENKHAFKNGEWNDFRIECVGDSIKTYINGTQIADVKDDMTHTGFIGLQVHGVGGTKEPLEVRWRNIRIKNLDTEEWTDLFDGKSLDGWFNPYEWGQAKVVDGEIHLKANRKFFLTTEETYGDFTFEGEVKLPDRESNSGFQFRSHAQKNRVFGYQAEVDPSGRAWAGGLYDEGRRGWLNPLKDTPSAQLAFEPEEWNAYRVECDGDHLQIFVNGVRTTNYRDPMDITGHFAVQHHGEDGKLYRFRNIRVKDQGEHVWKPIFNGKNFEGWHKLPGGKWEIEDGVIKATQKASDNRHGLLVTDREFEDFTARLKFRHVEGNSGFYFRVKEVDEAVHVHGFQAEIEDGGETGGLYETAGRAWVAKPNQKVVKKAFKQDGWNELVVSAHGGWIVTYLNGHKMVELKEDPGRKKGHLALQLHGGQDMEVYFKDVAVLKKAK